jgi:hypothetical protein
MWNNQIIEIVIVLTKRLLSMNCTLQNFVYLRFNLLPEVCLVHICNMLILILETINFLLEKNVKHSDHWNCDCVDETIAFSLGEEWICCTFVVDYFAYAVWSGQEINSKPESKRVLVSCNTLYQTQHVHLTV